MDSQPKEQRIRQLRMWQKESKTALSFLKPIKNLLEGFKDTHSMHIPHLSEAISEVDKAIANEEDLFALSTNELEEIKS